MPKQLVTIQGTNQEIELNDKDFIYEGGEGSIYGKQNTVFKIYLNPAKIIAPDKLRELSVLDDKFIIKPNHFITDKKGKKIGYCMDWIKDASPLACLFTRSFKQRNSIQPDDVIKLVKELQRIVFFTHSKKILVVDLNEMNFMTDKKFKKIYAIDVDSYQTPSYPATAIADQIRDRHIKKFNENSDWFSFGIVSFQMLTNIHPYKGSHPKFHGPKLDQMEQRMIQNISVFDKDAGYPPSVEPFDNIPQTLREWYKAVFQDGKRLPPPQDYQGVLVVQTTTKVGRGKYFIVTDDLELSSAITAIFAGDNPVFYCGKQCCFSDKYFNIPDNALPYVTPKQNQLFFFSLDGNKLKIQGTDGKETDSYLFGDKIFNIDGRIYLKNESSILEIVSMELKNVVKFMSREVAKVMSNATQIHDGFLLQNIVGHYHGNFFPESEKAFQVKLPELDGYRVIDAKYENRVLVAIRIKGGKTERVTYRFAEDFKSQDVQIVDDDSANFTVTTAGVFVLMNNNNEIEVSRNQIGSKTTICLDPAVDSMLTLFSQGNVVKMYKNRKIIRLSTK